MKQTAATIALASLLLITADVRCEESPVNPVSATPPAETTGKESLPVKPGHGVKDNGKMMKMMSGMGKGGEETQTISGKVVEVLAGGSYTYLCLEKDGQKTWVAVPGRETKVGEELTVMPGNMMYDFQSKALNRTFDKIIFSGGVVEQKPAAKVPDEQSTPLTGKVLKSMNGGGYTYVLLKKKESAEEVWLAVPPMRLIVGKEMTFAPGVVMSNFPSKALDRTFDKIVFSPGPVQGKNTSKEGKSGTKPADKKGAPAVEEKISVDKAEGPGAYRVAELFKLKNKLNKKKVVVRGKVVSISANIMKKNWIHLQDGSGDPKKKNNDLVVTSQDLPAEGDVITASGILAKDINLANHTFPVVVQDAEIVIK